MWKNLKNAALLYIMYKAATTSSIVSQVQLNPRKGQTHSVELNESK